MTEPRAGQGLLEKTRFDSQWAQEGQQTQKPPNGGANHLGGFPSRSRTTNPRIPRKPDRKRPVPELRP
jgi:hypothetical protein